MAESPRTLALNTTLIDVEHLGRSQVIAACLLLGGGDAVLVDPGPTSSLEHLRAGLEQRGVTVRDLTAILLTHIHLDHAGATGTLVAENPGIRVYVHERGARHLVDPTKLLASATRLYGEEMDRLWGAFLAVPQNQVVALRGGETLRLADRRLEVADTPGHASHHVAYFDDGSGIAFVGDTAGIRITNLPYVLAPTPPPDINLEAWRKSLDRFSAWAPASLFLTHFGLAEGVPAHLAELRERLEERAAAVRRSLTGDDTDAARAAAYARDVGRSLRGHLSDENARRYEGAAPQADCWYGLARYWRKRDLG